jgi:hypothetical protein
LTSSGLAGRVNIERAVKRPFEDTFASWVATLLADGMLGVQDGAFHYDPPKRDAITKQTVGIALKGSRSVNCDTCRGQRAVLALDGPVYEPDPTGNWSVQGGSARFFKASGLPTPEVELKFSGDSSLMAVYLMP